MPHHFFAKKFLISPFELPPILLFVVEAAAFPVDCALISALGLDTDSTGGSSFVVFFSSDLGTSLFLPFAFAFAGGSSASSTSVTDSYEE